MRPKALLFLFCLILSGCATMPNERGTQSARVDPLESMNRSIFTFNDKFDTAVAKPVARAYVTIFPTFIQAGIGNFFGNIRDIWTASNSFLQGNVQDGLTDIARISLNSTFGLLGILDIASEAKIPKHRTDFGQTLGVWGVANGPYLVIPFLGPSVLRNTIALPVDYYGDLWGYYDPANVRHIGSGLRLVDKRASFLDSSNLLEDAALDKYIFVRDAFLQREASQIEIRKNGEIKHRDSKEMQKQYDEDAKGELEMSTTAETVKTSPN